VTIQMYVYYPEAGIGYSVYPLFDNVHEHPGKDIIEESDCFIIYTDKTKKNFDVYDARTCKLVGSGKIPSVHQWADIARVCTDIMGHELNAIYIQH